MASVTRRLFGPTAGLFLAVVAGWFIYRSLSRDWPRVTDALTSANVFLIILAGGVSAVGMILLAVGWAWELQRDAPGHSLLSVIDWFFAGELVKYIPGGVWPVLGRGELARRAGVAPSVAFLTAATSLFYRYGAAVVGLALLLPLLPETPLWAIAALIVGSLAVLTGCLPSVFVWGLDRLVKMTGRDLEVTAPGFTNALMHVASYLPAWLAIGTSSWVVSEALGFSGSFPRLVLATVAGWLAGFVAIPAPSGAGVREAVFVFLAGIPRAEAAAVAVVARGLFLVVDVAGFALATSRMGRTAVQGSQAG
ncbi:MAG: lysylphosphatidylglycerol synthase domain-containing protein [Microthrixaceae bacterium]